MLLLFLVQILCTDRIKLKLVGDDKFLGVSGDKLVKANYRNALSIKLNTMKDISKKSLEGRNNKALTETGFWFFPKRYTFKKNKNDSNQAFRIVYYAPNEYLLMKSDSCLGFKSGKFKRVDCKIDQAAKFRICTNRLCDTYLDLKKDLECIKGFLGMGGLNNRQGKGLYGYGGNRDDSSSDSNSRNDSGGSNPFVYGGSKPWKSGRRGKFSGSSDTDSSSDSNEVFSGRKEYKYGIPGYQHGNSRYPFGSKHSHGRGRPLYDRNDRSGFPYNC